MAFTQAHDFKIDTFNVDQHHHYSHITHLAPTSDPMQLLRDARAVEATHTSTTAAYAPKCRPGSRAKVIQDITDWITIDAVRISPSGTPTSILWFQGPAGGGKTCIMREVVARCEKLGLLTASYFFSTRVAGLNNETPFVVTIACQLAKDAIMRAEMSQAVVENPDLLKESLDFQAYKLFLTPCPNSEGPIDGPPQRRKIVVIDGFDECRECDERGDGSVRTHLLDLLQKVATSPRNFLVVIASRPEVDIRTAFASPLYRSNTHIVRLQDYDGTSEIRGYFCDEFCAIRESHPARESIPPNWPTEDILEPLVDKSSGSYIYPSTVIKYVRNPRRNPVALLREVLSLEAANSNPLAELDALYHHILHPSEVDIPVLKRLLHCIRSMSVTRSLCHAAPGTLPHIAPPLLDGLLTLPPGTTCTTLCDLHSLVSVPMGDDDGPLRFHHKSLEDYLCSPERSGDLHQPPKETIRDITQACLSYLQDWPHKAQLEFELISERRSTALSYAVDYWTAYLCMLDNGVSSFPSLTSNFDPSILWKIQLISPRDPATRGMKDELSGAQNTLHRSFCRAGGCTPFCNRASQLLKIVDHAESFRKRNAKAVEKDALIRASENKIEDLIARFEAEVLSLAPPYPARPPSPEPPRCTAPATKLKPPINSRGSFTPSETRPGSRISSSSRTPNRPRGSLLSPRPLGHSPRPKSSGLQVGRRDNDAQPKPISRSKSTTPVSANRAQGTVSGSRRTPVRSPGKDTPKKPSWR